METNLCVLNKLMLCSKENSYSAILSRQIDALHTKSYAAVPQNRPSSYLCPTYCSVALNALRAPVDEALSPHQHVIIYLSLFLAAVRANQEQILFW